MVPMPGWRRVPDPKLAMIPLAAMVAVLPMLLRGASCGHDFDFHLLSWLEAATQLSHGSYPHWAYTPAFNAGEPRFVFYPPLSWLLGAALGMVLPWTLVPAAFVWVALTLAGTTFYRLARVHLSSPVAVLTAVLYLANPYMLFTAYERSAFAELLAAAWLPLLLAAALPGRDGPGRPMASRVTGIAVPLALVWLTNAPAAVMFSYALAFLTLVRLVRRTREGWSRWRLGGTTVAGTVLGLALAGFYIIPAAYERPFVQISMVVIEGMRVNDHFLFHRMPGHSADDLFHDAVVRTASLVVLGLLGGIAAGLAAARLGVSRAGVQAELLVPLGLLAGAIALMLTPASLPVWHLLPQMQFLQFPWRLGALLGAILALAAGLAVPETMVRNRVATVTSGSLLAVLLVVPAWQAFHQECDAEDSVPARVALFHSGRGTEATDEYTPAEADPEALQPGDPQFWTVPARGKAGEVNGAPASPAAPGGAPDQVRVEAPEPEYLVLNRREYPRWEVFRNHTKVTSVQSPRDDGLIAVPLPMGASTVEVRWRNGPDQWAGEAVSGVALVVLVWNGASRRRRGAIPKRAEVPAGPS